MKSFFLVAAFFIFCISDNLYTQSRTFQKTFGGIKHDIANSLDKTNDGGYIIAGQSSSNYNNILVIKTDINGDTIWTRLIGDSTGADKCNVIRQTQDGGFLLAGGTYNFMPLGSGEAMYLIKMNSIGNITWSKLFVYDFLYSSQSEANDIVETSNGFLVTGWNSYTNIVKTFVLEINNFGDMLSYRTFGDTLNETYGNSIDVTPAGYAVAGRVFGWSEINGGNNNIYFFRYTDASQLVDNYSIGGDFDDEAMSVKRLEDGSYVITGYTKSYGVVPGESDVFLMKLDQNAGLQWFKTYGTTGYDIGYDVKLTNDGGFTITGQTSENNDVILIKTDRNGNLEWSKQYGLGSMGDAGYEVQQCPDNGFIICGSTNSGVYNDFYLVKTDELGNSGCYENNAKLVMKDTIPSIRSFINHPGNNAHDTTVKTNILNNEVQAGIICDSITNVQESEIQNYIGIYPNPADDKLSIICDVKNNGQMKVSIYDIYGNIRIRKLIQNNKEENIIDVSELTEGIYFV